MSNVELVESELEVDGHKYYLLPNADQAIHQYFEEQCGYKHLAEQAQTSFSGKTTLTVLNDEHLTVIPNLLHEELCQSLINEFENDPKGIQHESVAEVLMKEVFTEEIDQQIKSYFGSEYCIFWWSIYKVENQDEEAWYSTKWHCDGGPQKQLKVITYLNSYDEHESDTSYLNQQATDKLKDVGYIFNKIDKRSLDIEPLCQHLGIDYQPQAPKPTVGDTIIFNPHQLAHRAKAPKPGKTRYALNFCLLPSELDWRTVARDYYFPSYDCQDFSDFAPIAKKINHSKSVDNSCIEIGLNFQLESMQHVEYLIANVIKNTQVASYLVQYISRDDEKLIKHKSIFELMKFIKTLIIGQLNPDNVLGNEWLEALSDISRYEQEFIDSSKRYQLADKPNPEAVFWPNPDHEKYPLSKFDMLPYVKKQPIMDFSTPIGSAGSCFAFEIAKYFQQQGYNYVVTERNDDPESGLLVDGYQPGDKIAKFCANFGILFNTPSFKQLAEKAFGYRQFNKLLFQHESGYYIDPYRENVLFASKEAYLTDYDKHVNAIREAFMQCKVFVVTLGLNECWQLKDGSVMSRNPRENIYHLVKHRTLTVQENVDNIQRFFDIIKQHNPDFKLIISVSPIPFLATGRADEQHIISANCHSKSVLRVAADQLVSQNEDMYYLPSYELVTECTKDAWDSDTRHVKSETVAKVVSMFQEIFVHDN